MFRDQWDKIGQRQHGTEWPTVFLQTLAGVLERWNGGEEDAFSTFLFDQERQHFAGQAALAVPPARQDMLALTL